MRTFSLQVQPDKSPGIDMGKVGAAFEVIATRDDLVTGHKFNRGNDDVEYFNYNFDTRQAPRLWELIRTRVYDDSELGRHMKRASIAICSSEAGWDDYVLLFHYDPAEKLDEPDID